MVVLLDNKMQLVKPVYDYMKLLRQEDKALNTQKAYASDLGIFWEFLNEIGYEFDEVTLNVIREFIDYLRRGGQDIFALKMESVRGAKTINRILGTVRRFYCYISSMLEQDEPILKKRVNKPFNMFQSFLEHAKKR
jgi:site-specific recombinase XerD